MRFEKFNYLVFLLFISIITVMILNNCSSPKKDSSIPAPITEPTPVEEPVTPTKSVTCKSGVWCYDGMVETALKTYGKAILVSQPKDATSWCKNLNNTSLDNKIKFYVTLVHALAYHESSYKPEATYKENFKDQKGNYIISTGLLQLSQESANASIYRCGITNAAMLKDPQININCGVKIMNKWIVGDGVIQGGGTGAWRGMSRYWSPFRKSDRINTMKSKVKLLDFCK